LPEKVTDWLGTRDGGDENPSYPQLLPTQGFISVAAQAIMLKLKLKFDLSSEANHAKQGNFMFSVAGNQPA
jgi:hypothetical protein